MSLKIRRGTNAERLTIIPVEGELIYTTDGKNLYIGDGVTSGGKFITGVGYTGSNGVGYTGSASTILGPTGYVGSAGEFSGTLTSNMNGQGNDIVNITNIGFTGSIYNSKLSINGSTLTINDYNYLNIRNKSGTNVIAEENDHSLTIYSPSAFAYHGADLALSSYLGTYNSPLIAEVGTNSGAIAFSTYTKNKNAPDGYQVTAFINSQVSEVGNGTTTVTKSKIELGIQGNGLDLASLKLAEFNHHGAFSAPVIRVGLYNGSANYPTISSSGTKLDWPAGSLTKGMIIFDTSDNHFYGYNGTIWKQLDN